MAFIIVQEQRAYSREKLLSDFEISTAEFDELFSKLSRNNILLFKKEYVFYYVGVLCYKNHIIICMPKYLQDIYSQHHVGQLLRLLQAYSRRETLVADELETLGFDSTIENNSRLSLILFLLNDYYENGWYRKEKSIHVVNGDNEIDWAKTIESADAVVSNRVPLYLETHSRESVHDEDNYIYHLHQSVISACYDFLDQTGLNHFFNYPPLDTDGGIIDFHDELTAQRVSREMSQQFVDKKLMTLKALYAYVTADSLNMEGTPVDIYGTRSFHVVWEKVCGYVLGNQYDSLQQYIAKPCWESIDGYTHFSETLIPDIILDLAWDRQRVFMIIDAKYYHLAFGKELKNNPGVGDLTKQYLYQLAYKEYIGQRKFGAVCNILLFPAEIDYFNDLGTVEIEFLDTIGLEKIRVMQAPTSDFFERYINRRRLTVQELAQLL